MKKMLIAILIGIAFGVFFFVVAVLADGACHCVKPTIVLYPYAGIALLYSWEYVSLPLMAIQFPVYAAAIAKAKRVRWTALSVLIILLLHALLAFVGLRLYRQ